MGKNESIANLSWENCALSVRYALCEGLLVYFGVMGAYIRDYGCVGAYFGYDYAKIGIGGFNIVFFCLFVLRPTISYNNFSLPVGF